MAEGDNIWDKQVAGLAAVVEAVMHDLIGQRITPELIEQIRKRVAARAAIVDQLVEHEHEE